MGGLLFGGVAVWGNLGLGEFWCVVVAVWGVAVCGSFGVWELQSAGIERY